MQEGMGGAAQSAGDTFTGALSNVKAALSRLGETAATPFLNGLRSLFNQAIPVVDSFTAAVKPTLEQVGATVQKGLEQAIPTVQNFFKQLGQNQTVQQLLDSFGRLVGKIGELAGSLAGAASSVWGEFSGQLSGLAGLLPGIVDLLGRLVDGLSGVFDFIGAHASTLVPLAEGISAVVLAGKGVGTVTSGIKTLSGVLGSIAEGAAGVANAAQGVAKFITLAGELGGIGPALKTLTSGFSVMKNAISAFSGIAKAASTVWTVFTGVLAANPFGVIVTLIGAVVAALTWFFTQTETGRQLWQSFMDWLQPVWQTVQETWSQAWTAISDFLTTIDLLRQTA